MFLISISSVAITQVTLKDIEKCASSEVETFIEYMSEKGFEFSYKIQDGFMNDVGIAYPKRYGPIKIDHSFRGESDEEWFFEFEKEYANLFKKVESDIKLKYKKQKYFYSNRWGTYVAQYSINGKFVLIGKKPYSNIYSGEHWENGFICISNYWSPYH